MVTELVNYRCSLHSFIHLNIPQMFEDILVSGNMVGPINTVVSPNNCPSPHGVDGVGGNIE